MAIARRLVALFWLPSLLLLSYAALRSRGVRGETDLDGISAVLRVLFLSFGASVAYFMSLLPEWQAFRQRIEVRFWLGSCAWFVATIADDSFMLHENLGKLLGVPDSLLLLALGLVLGMLLYSHRARLRVGFWLPFGGFASLAVIALLADFLSGREGVIQLGSLSLDYEQVLETLSVLCLAAAFCAQAIGELCAAAGRPMPLPEGVPVVTRRPRLARFWAVLTKP